MPSSASESSASNGMPGPGALEALRARARTGARRTPKPPAARTARADAAGVEAGVVDLRRRSRRRGSGCAARGETSSPTSSSTSPYQPSSPLRLAASVSWSVSSTTSTPGAPAGPRDLAHRAGPVRVASSAGGSRRPGRARWVVSDENARASSTLEVGGETARDLPPRRAPAEYDVARLPYSLKVLLENLLRHGEDGRAPRRGRRSWVADRRAVDARSPTRPRAC